MATDEQRLNDFQKILPEWFCECGKVNKGWHCECGFPKPKRENPQDLTNPDAMPHGPTWFCNACGAENWFPLGNCRSCGYREAKKGYCSGTDINHPKHYSRFNIEPIRFCMENNLDALQKDVVKYICRHDMKGGLDDVKKALRYAQMVAEHHYGVHIPIDWDNERPVDGITT